MAIRERQRERVGDQRHRPVGRLDLTRLGHRGNHRFDVAQIVGVLVEGDDVRASAQRLERVPPSPASEIEEGVALVHLEAVVVDGQHG